MADKFIDKIKFFWGADAVEDDFIDDDSMDREVVQEEKSYGAPTLTSGPSASSTNNRVLNLHTGNQMKVVLYYPKSLDDAREVVNALKTRKPVVINLLGVEKEIAKSIFDFCMGGVFAMDGHIQPVSKGVYVLAPANVDVIGDVKGELENKGVYPWQKESE